MRGCEQERRIDVAVAHPLPDRGALASPGSIGFRISSFGMLSRFGRHLTGDLRDEFHLTAVNIEAALLEQQPIVEARMHAAGANLLAAQVGDAVDAGVGPDHELRLHRIQGLSEVHPLVAARAMAVGRDVIAADELNLPARHGSVRVALADLVVVVDVKPMPGPRT
jgi:hypothetical protein